jgi:hypothetical protein
MRAVRIIVCACAIVSGQTGAAPVLAQDKSVDVMTTVEGPIGAARADFSPQETARLAHGAIPFTATFEDSRFPGMRFPTTRPIEGVITTPLEVHQGRAGSSAVQSPPRHLNR